MKKNMGTNDRLLRIVAAVILAFLYFSGSVSGTIGWVLLILAIVFTATSLVGFCPLYVVFGLNTCPKNKK